MKKTNAGSAELGTFLRAAGHGARQWRLSLLWMLGLLLPTAVVVWPVWRALSAVLDFSPRVAALAQQLDLLMLSDVLVLLGRSAPALGGAAALATLLMLVMAPFVAGLTVTAAHEARALGFRELLQGGVALYWRMFRLLLVSLVPLLVLGALSGGAFKVAGKRAEQVFLDAQAQRGRLLATLVCLLLFWVIHALIEAARAQLASDHGLQSAWRALFRGLRLLRRKPLLLLGLYLVPTLLSLTAAALLISLRIRVAAGSSGTLVAGLLLTELAVASIGLGKVSRLFALTALCRGSMARPLPDARSDDQKR